MTISSSPYRKDFPFFLQSINRERYYLDSAATSQKPNIVINALVNYYLNDNANIYRGLYETAQRATEQFESVRDQVQHFINANRREEIIFTKGATQSLNWVAFGYFAQILKPGDEILLSVMEHHSNLVPWQQIAVKTGAKLSYVKLDENEEFDLHDFKKKLNSHVKVVAVSHISNVLGSINPIQTITKLAHQVGSLVVVDGAQAVGHISIDVQKLDCDFYCFSGHKMFSPTGVGILYGKYSLLNHVKPIEFGGEMIEEVDYYKTTFKELPFRLEGGTSNIAGVIGLGAAIKYFDKIGLDVINKYNRELTEFAILELKKISGIKIYGPENPEHRNDLISFNIKGIHSHDAVTIFDAMGVEVRAGHHCAEVLMKYLKIPACLRASFHIYNDQNDIFNLIQAIKEGKRFFNHETF